MKPLTICLVLFFFSNYSSGQQNSSGVISNGVLNHIYFLRTDSLTALVQSDGRMESKTRAMGYGGSEAGIMIDGDRSTLRIKGADSIRFAVKLVTGMMDPTMMIRLYKLDPRKGKREAVMSMQGGAYSKEKSTNNPNEISLHIQKSGSQDYIMIPASRLMQGEYGFMNMMMISVQGSRSPTYTLFTFGID
jgi:hypothetical protein